VSGEARSQSSPPGGTARGSRAHSQRPGVRSPGPGLIGREFELAAVDELVSAVESGSGQATLFAGEPGIGKTRLAEEVAAAWARDVAWGRCAESDGAPAFWPWTQVFRSVLREVGTGGLRERLGPDAGDLVAVLPELRTLVPDLTERSGADQGEVRSRLFDTAVELVRAVTTERPWMLVLDDLHRADVPSLRLLAALLASLPELPVLVVGTFRDTEVGAAPGLGRLLGELSTHSRVRTFTLSGLSAPEARQLFRDTLVGSAGRAIPPEVVERAGGNPFFLGEMARLMSGDPSWRLSSPTPPAARRMPGTVRETIRHRADLLPESTRRALWFAAVLGQEFRAAALAPVLDGGWEAALAALAPAERSGLIDPDPLHLGHYRFRHALVREALYEDLSPVDRLAMHQQAAEILQGLYQAEEHAHLEELAHQFYRAVPRADRATASRYCEMAAAKTSGNLAYEEAARYLEMLLELRRIGPERDPAGDCAILLQLGQAWSRAGDREAARTWFGHAFDSALHRGDAAQAAQASLGYGGLVVAVGVSDDRLIDRLQMALDLCPGDAVTTRAQLTARMAMELYWSSDRPRGEGLSLKALRLAREGDDAATLGFALNARRFVHWGPDHPGENLTDTEELLAVAEQAGSVELRFQGHRWLFVDHLETGLTHAAIADVQACARLAERTRQPLHRWYVEVYRGNLALFQGRFPTARRHAEQALEIGRRAQSEAAEMFYLGQAFFLAWDTGGLIDLDDPAAAMADAVPGMPFFRCMHAVVLAATGRPERALDILRRFAGNDFADIPRDVVWQGSLCLLAEVAADLAGHLADRAAAERLYLQLARHAGGNTLIGSPATIGSTHRTLGRLAAILDRPADADRHLARAVDDNLAWTAPG
jgi:eukaryotic-like serine/threonine-protein kinase